MANIEWQHYLGYEDLGFPGAADCDVEELEYQLDVTFPEDYREALFDHQGTLPVPNVLPINAQRRTEVGCLLHVNDRRPKDQAYCVFFQLERLKEYSYEKMVPIFRTGTGWVCFDFNDDETAPPVVFVNSDLEKDEPGSVIKVADSFTDLLNKLEDDA